MKKILALLTTLVALAALSKAAPQIGQPAPDFTLTGTDGQEHKLSNYKGKFIVLEWTNYDCPFVHKHYDSGNMQKLQKEYTAKDVVWLSIISSAPGKQGHLTPEQAKQTAGRREQPPPPCC